MSPRNPMNRRAGFTLLEVIVALGAMSVIAMLSFSALSGSLAARDALEAEEEHARAVGGALDRISRHLELAFLTSNTSAQETYRTVFVGKDENELDMIWFASLGHQRRYKDSRESDQTEITFWTEDDPHMDGAYVLLMREGQRVDHEPDQDGVIQPLVHGVARFDLRYLDPVTGGWTDEWDSTGADQPNRLPRAVQIVLVLHAQDPQDERLTVLRPYVRTVGLTFAKTLNATATANFLAADAAQ